MDTSRQSADAAKFVLGGVATSLALFGVLRTGWTEASLVMPFTRAQSGWATALFGSPAVPVAATLACSGTDVLALCLGAVLAYPVRWRARLSGAALGAILIVGLNTVRIGTLGLAAATPAWFNALHLYLWPALFTLTIAAYVLTWMRLADAPGAPSRLAPVVQHAVAARWQPSRLFVGLTGLFVVLFVAAGPFYLETAAVAALTTAIAGAAAAVLNPLGIGARAAGNVLWTAHGGFMVTPECVSTPLIPVYLAGICAYSPTARRLALGLIAALPLFIVLAIARLLVVALPTAIASPMFAVHAFYQLLLAAVLVFVAARWRHVGAGTAVKYGVGGIAAGVLFVRLAGPLYTATITPQFAAALGDPQGALALLPAFQVGLYLALWIAAFLTAGWRRFLAGLAILVITQTTGLAVLQLLTTYGDLTAHVRDIRGWAIAGPLVIVAAVVNVGRADR
jgi:exosortase/archaeosortase family protein